MSIRILNIRRCLRWWVIFWQDRSFAMQNVARQSVMFVKVVACCWQILIFFYYGLQFLGHLNQSFSYPVAHSRIERFINVPAEVAGFVLVFGNMDHHSLCLTVLPVVKCINVICDLCIAIGVSAMGHWGTCPLDFQPFNFSGHRRSEPHKL